jgi:hypothetical protein
MSLVARSNYSRDGRHESGYASPTVVVTAKIQDQRSSLLLSAMV